MKETLFVILDIDGKEVISRIEQGTDVFIADNPELFKHYWDNRKNIIEIVHSHPESFKDFSSTDRGTMERLEKHVFEENQDVWFSIVTPDFYLGYSVKDKSEVELNPEAVWWLPYLRLLTNYFRGEI